VDWKVLRSFGVASALGGLTGAMLQSVAGSRWLTVIFGALLLAAAMSEHVPTGRWRFRGWTGWIAGVLSGLLGGMVGNQGGLRSAALLGFDLSKAGFVATATAVGLIVDGVRLPIYLATQYQLMTAIGRYMLIGTIGVVLGTLVGSRALAKIPERLFHRVLALVLAALGLSMLARGVSGG
jgi:uncharacterized membrane protein YfcA